MFLMKIAKQNEEQINNNTMDERKRIVADERRISGDEEEGKEMFPVEIFWEENGWKYKEILFWDAEKKEEKEIYKIMRDIIRDIVVEHGKIDIERRTYESIENIF